MAKQEEATTTHTAKRNAKIGTTKDGKPRKIIEAGKPLKLTKAQVESYKSQNII